MGRFDRMHQILARVEAICRGCSQWLEKEPDLNTDKITNLGMDHSEPPCLPSMKPRDVRTPVLVTLAYA